MQVPQSYIWECSCDNIVPKKSNALVNIIDNEENNLVWLHLYPGADQTGKVVLLAEPFETGTSGIE
jgi:hypothetical protein